MTRMEWFRNVGTRELDYDTLPSFTRIIGVFQTLRFVEAKLSAELANHWNDGLCQRGFSREEGKKVFGHPRLLKQGVIVRELIGPFLSQVVGFLALEQA